MSEQELMDLVASLFQFYYCPKCGKILDIVRHPIWSHDHSLEIGYVLISTCIFCHWSEVYTDVE